MKRFGLILIALTVGCLMKPHALASSPPSWHGDAPLYAQALRTDVDQPCSYMQTWAHPDFTISGCIDDYRQSVDMAFGQLSSTGRLRLGDLPYVRQIILPPGYLLYPIAGSSGALLVGDDGLHYADRPVAYYPDVIAALSWPDLTLRFPTPEQQFRSGNEYLYLLRDGLASSANGRWVIGEDRGGQPVRLNLQAMTVDTFADSLRGKDDHSGDQYLWLMHGAISDDGKTIFMVNPYDHAHQAATLYDMTCAAVCRRSLTAYFDNMMPGYVYALKPVFINDEALEFTSLRQAPERGLVYDNYRLTLIQPAAQAGYLAMGDSFASGEGAFYYRTQTDTTDNKCHTSLAAYSYILRPASQSVACSGARLKDVDGSAWGQRSGRAKASYPDTEVAGILATYLPGNINQIEFLKKYHPQTATISIGGNDIGFADIMKQCIDPRGNWRNGASCYPTYEDRYELFQSIYDLYDKLLATYRKLTAASPETDLYVIGYPQIISPTGSCGINVQLNEGERELAVELTEALNETIASAAISAGVHFVDVAHAFDGHRLCETGQPAVNGITAGDDGLRIAGHPLLGQESFHPTAYGHRLMAAAIDDATRGFHLRRLNANPHSSPQVDPLKPALSTAKQVGRLIRQRSTSQTMAPGKAKQKVVIAYKNDSKRLKANQTVTVEVGPKKITTLSDATGNVDATLDISDLRDTGYYDIHIYGTDPFDELVDIVKTIWLERADEPDDVQLSLGVGQLGSGGL